MSQTTTATPRVARRPFMAWAAACTALALGLSAVGAQAQPRDQRQDNRHDSRNGPSHGPQQRPGQPQPRPPQAPQSQARPHNGPPPQAHAPQRPWRGAGPDHRWHRGDRVPQQYRSRHYVVNDWRMHHLSQPPRGYHWVQYGGDYLLIAIATGVIAQIILSQ